MIVAAMTQARPALTEVDLDVPSMGGRLRLRVACTVEERRPARHDLELVARRVGRWAARLTRFEPGSELCALDADPEAAATPVGPTLAAVLAWASDAARRTRGVVDVSLLDERLASEHGGHIPPQAGRSRWELRPSSAGRRHVVAREGRVRFDLDGVAKGWIADRALAALRRYPGGLVDADGDIAIAAPDGADWTIGVADPKHPGRDLVVLAPHRIGSRIVGIATSGIDVHRWGDSPERHHLIDPMTGRPSTSDVTQCTVVAESAALAEAVAKAVVIRGSDWGLGSLGQPGVLGAVLVRRNGEVLVTEEALPWLA